MTTGNTYVPLTLDLIEEGNFKRDLEKAMADAQEALIEFVEEHQERAGKAKSVVDISIEFECVNIDSKMFEVTPRLKVKVPARPARTTAVMAGFDRKKNQAVLFVRDTGSTEGDPNQMHLPMSERADTRSEM